MKLTATTNMVDAKTVVTFQFELPAYEWVLSKLSPDDFLLIRECEKSTKISAKLLALQLIALRIEEFKEQVKMPLDVSDIKLI